jgi:hypothetical protein
MHHDETCGQAGSAAECCNHARTQDSNGVVVAKHEAPTVMVALLPPVVIAPWLSQVPVFRVFAVDTGPPPRSTPLHIVLSVFLI